MSTAGFEAFLRQIGHTVIHESGIAWFDAQPRVFSPLPFDIEIDPSHVDWPSLFAHGALAVRCAVLPPWGRPSYRLVVDTPDFDLSRLTAKSRNQTRRGLEACTVRPVDARELATQALGLQRETLIRQGRRIPADFRRYWTRYYECAMAEPSAFCWGAFKDTALAAFLIAFRMDEVAHILIVRSSTELLRHYPNNALLFTFVKHALTGGGCREVSIGFESLQPELNTLDHFKEGLGFRRKPTHQYVRLAPVLDRILRGITLDASIAGLAPLVRYEKARKLAGLLRWHRDQVRGHAG